MKFFSTIIFLFWVALHTIPVSAMNKPITKSNSDTELLQKQKEAHYKEYQESCRIQTMRNAIKKYEKEHSKGNLSAVLTIKKRRPASEKSEITGLEE
jgi:hypothetical protein